MCTIVPQLAFSTSSLTPPAHAKGHVLSADLDFNPVSIPYYLYDLKTSEFSLSESWFSHLKEGDDNVTCQGATQGTAERWEPKLCLTPSSMSCLVNGRVRAQWLRSGTCVRPHVHPSHHLDIGTGVLSCARNREKREMARETLAYCIHPVA